MVKKSEVSVAGIGLWSTIALGMGYNLSTLFGKELSYALCGVGIVGIGTVVNSLIKTDDRGWEDLWKEIGIENKSGEVPLLVKEYDTEYSQVKLFTLPLGENTETFKKEIPSIANFLNFEEGERIKMSLTETGKVKMEIFETLDETVPFHLVEHNCIIPIVVGKSIYGYEVVDLVKIVHLLVAGSTGSGKSTFLRVLITTIILKAPWVKLVLFDFKLGNEFQYFDKCEAVTRFCISPKNAVKHLQELLDESLNRSLQFVLSETKDIVMYNKKFPKNKMEYIVAIIDEYADFSAYRRCQELMTSLAQKARSTGIYLIACTQSPRVKFMDGSIKANMTARVGFAIAQNEESKIIDIEGVSKLRGRGHGIFRNGRNQIEFQAMNIEPDEVTELMKKHNMYTQKSMLLEKVKKLVKKNEPIEESSEPQQQIEQPFEKEK